MGGWNKDKQYIVTETGVNSGMSHIIFFFNPYFLVYQLIFSPEVFKESFFSPFISYNILYLWIATHNLKM